MKTTITELSETLSVVSDKKNRTVVLKLKDHEISMSPFMTYHLAIALRQHADDISEAPNGVFCPRCEVFIEVDPDEFYDGIELECDNGHTVTVNESDDVWNMYDVSLS